MSEPFIGQIMPVGFNFAPRGWALCDGQLLAIAQNTALFSLLGTIYGGDGRTTFALPDLRGRVPLHFGTGPGLSPYSIGQRAGAETHILQTNEIPSHTHTASALADVRCQTQVASTHVNNPDGAVWATDAGTQSATYSTAAPNASMRGGAVEVQVTVNNTGANREHNNIQPFLVINWCIAVQGIFPSRS